MNLLELRQVLAWGALLAARPGPRAVLARHLVDSTSPVGVDNFWRLVGMVLRPGERVHLEVLTEAIEDEEGRPPLTRPVDVDAVLADVGGPRLGRDRPRGPGRRADRLRVRRGAVPRQAMADDPPGGGVRDEAEPARTWRRGSRRSRPRSASLEERVAEGQALHQRFAELLDVVTELLVPLAGATRRPCRPRSSRYVDELGS